MIKRCGAAEAARRLVISGDIQTGFEHLIRANRPELTIELAILHSRWEPLNVFHPVVAVSSRV
jgi:hypothetical protein